MELCRHCIPIERCGVCWDEVLRKAVTETANRRSAPEAKSKIEANRDSLIELEVRQHKELLVAKDRELARLRGKCAEQAAEIERLNSHEQGLRERLHEVLRKLNEAETALEVSREAERKRAGAGTVEAPAAQGGGGAAGGPSERGAAADEPQPASSAGGGGEPVGMGADIRLGGGAPPEVPGGAGAAEGHGKGTPERPGPERAWGKQGRWTETLREPAQGDLGRGVGTDDVRADGPATQNERAGA